MCVALTLGARSRRVSAEGWAVVVWAGVCAGATGTTGASAQRTRTRSAAAPARARRDEKLGMVGLGEVGYLSILTRGRRTRDPGRVARGSGGYPSAPGADVGPRPAYSRATEEPRGRDACPRPASRIPHPARMSTLSRGERITLGLA